MMDGIRDLKGAARILQRQARAQEPAALARLRQLDELRDVDDAVLAGIVKRRHTLAVLARELGFDGWSHVSSVLGGGTDGDFGTLLCPRGSDAYWNIWSASYDEARQIREQNDGYLLAYKLHFFVVDRHYIEMLGLDAADPDWALMRRDWVRPEEPAARERLYAKLIRQRLSR